MAKYFLFSDSEDVAQELKDQGHTVRFRNPEFFIAEGADYNCDVCITDDQAIADAFAAKGVAVEFRGEVDEGPITQFEGDPDADVWEVDGEPVKTYTEADVDAQIAADEAAEAAAREAAAKVIEEREKARLQMARRTSAGN